MASERDRFRLFKIAGNPIKIGGETKVFYPLSAASILQTEDVVKRVASAWATMSQSTAHDVTSSTRRVGNDASESIIEAASPEVLALRSKEKKEAVEDLVAALLDKKIRSTFCRWICESLKDEFPDKNDWPVDDSLLEEIPFSLLPEIVQAIIKTNAGKLGPLAQKATEFFEKEVAMSQEAGQSSKSKESGN